MSLARMRIASALLMSSVFSYPSPRLAMPSLVMSSAMLSITFT